MTTIPPQAARAINRLLHIEGSRYVEDDAGHGPSRYGLTLRWLHAAGLPDHPREITRSRAAEIYYEHWWLPMRLDQVEGQVIAEALLITAVHIGRERAVRYWQDALRAAGERIRVDGRFGPLTIAATARSGQQALRHFVQRLEEHYDRLARQPRYAQFARGWRRRLKLMAGDGDREG